jgi:nanoRNase/pAp phosphatase (c-di-AMP/oligoRNAs hydrolase)
VFTACLGVVPREDIVTYVSDFLLQVEDVKWTVVAGLIDDKIVISVRNVGYTRHAGTFIKKWFDGIGSAGGHRAMAKAIVPVSEFQKQFRAVTSDDITSILGDLATQFIFETSQNT